MATDSNPLNLPINPERVQVVNRLSDMEAKEVSIVDRAANKRTFLLVKRDSVEKANIRREGGMEFSEEAFAYTPNPKRASGWKLRLYDTPQDFPDKPSVKLTAGAVLAMSPAGFRGQRVLIPDEDLPEVKAKVRAAWVKARRNQGVDVSDDQIPSMLKDTPTPPPQAPQAAMQTAAAVKSIVDEAPVAPEGEPMPKSVLSMLASIKLLLDRLAQKPESEDEDEMHPEPDEMVSAMQSPIALSAKKSISKALDTVIETLSKATVDPQSVSYDCASNLIGDIMKSYPRLAALVTNEPKAKGVAKVDMEGKDMQAAGAAVPAQGMEDPKKKKKPEVPVEESKEAAAPPVPADKEKKPFPPKKPEEAAPEVPVEEDKEKQFPPKKPDEKKFPPKAPMKPEEEVPVEGEEAKGLGLPKKPEEPMEKVGAPMQGDRLNRLKDAVKMLIQAFGELKNGSASMEKFQKAAGVLGGLINELDVKKSVGARDKRGVTPYAPNMGSGYTTDTKSIADVSYAFGEGTPGVLGEILKSVNELKSSNDTLRSELAKRDETINSLKTDLVEVKKLRMAPSSYDDQVQERKPEAPVAWPADMAEWR